MLRSIVFCRLARLSALVYRLIGECTSAAGDVDVQLQMTVYTRMLVRVYRSLFHGPVLWRHPVCVARQDSFVGYVWAFLRAGCEAVVSSYGRKRRGCCFVHLPRLWVALAFTSEATKVFEQISLNEFLRTNRLKSWGCEAASRAPPSRIGLAVPRMRIEPDLEARIEVHDECPPSRCLLRYRIERYRPKRVAVIATSRGL
ncbi:hypothetical protein KM043_012479 [Ampulex compressa]|nr:hypothetical protein KM043_012479 [Ampulex compressa]